MPDLTPIAESLRRFATVEAPGESPLYTRLALAASEEPALLELLTHRKPGQPVANMLFGSAQYLLAQEPGHPLRAWYPTLGGPGSDDDPFPLFRDFCLERREQMLQILSTHMVQTNEVRRSAGLFPAFSHLAQLTAKPLTLLEIGPSAGLNLLFDRYAYDYSGTLAGAPGSPVLIACESKGDPPPVGTVPDVTQRIGIDLNPLDARDDEAMGWLRALVWPEHTHRLAMLDAAIELARQSPPTLLGGDVFELLPRLIREADASSAVCVFATFVLNQFTEEMRERLRQLLMDAGARREVFFLGMGYSEFVTRQVEVPFEGSLWLVRLAPRGRSATRLGRFHHHGRWIEWGPEPAPLDW